MSYFASSDQRPDWVRNVPGSWKIDWLKWHVSLSTERPNDEQRATLPYLSNEDIASWTGKVLREDLEPYEADSRLFQAGNVLFNKLRPYLAKVFHADFNGTSSGELLCLRPSKRVDARYLFYVLTSFGFIDSVDSHTFGSKMPRADWEIVGHQPLPLPDIEIQKRIARFLDEKTTQIDALIEKKRALLDRLAEKRQALITHAVTKGLNPDVPMKPSDIDWLGDIPAHWEVLPLKRLVEDGEGLQMGPFGGMLTDLPNETTGFKLYGQENTISGDFNLGDRWVEEERFYDLQRYVLRPGDLVITRKGSLGSCRKVPEAVLPGIADSDTIRIRPKKRILIADWAITLLHDAQFVADQIASERRGAILSGLNTTVVGSIKLTVPPVDEQRLIILHVRDLVEPLDEAVALIESTENKLREHRTALITAAVTGQLPELNG